MTLKTGEVDDDVFIMYLASTTSDEEKQDCATV